MTPNGWLTDKSSCQQTFTWIGRVNTASFSKPTDDWRL